MAHDIKSPLATMLTYTDLVKQNKKGNLEDSQIDRLDKTGKAGRRLLRLLNDFVDYGRIQAGSLGLERTEFDLSEMLAEVKDGIEPIMEMKVPI